MPKLCKLPSMRIEFEVADKNGKIIRKGKRIGHSWVGNLIALLSSFAYGGSTSGATAYIGSTRADLTATDNTTTGIPVYTSGSYGYLFGMNAPAGDDTYGIVIGSSDVAVSLSQYNLQSKIPNGTGSGKMTYNTSTVESLTKSDIWYVRILRTFTNNSGSNITVKEIGLIMYIYPKKVMFARDVISGGITVPNGSVLTLRYIIQQSL